MSEFFSDEQNMADLVKAMPEEDAKRYLNLGHHRLEAAFADRAFIVYRPTGLTPSGKHNPPEILNLVKVIDFNVDIREGCYVVLKDQNTAQEMTVGHVPRKVFGYPIYMSVPVKLQLKYDARMQNDRVWRSLSFAVLIKAKNKADFYSKGNIYMETPNTFRRLYPTVTGQFKF